MKEVISTSKAPAAIGPYSQAIKVNQTIYLSGQIPLDPECMMLVSGDISLQTEQVLKNLQAVAQAAGGDLDHIVKLTIFLTDLNVFNTVNDVMKRFFQTPFPARSTIQVSALPKEAAIEIEAIMVI